MAQANAHVSEEGEMRLPMYFVDWPTKDTADELPGSRAIMMMAAKKAIALLSAFGRNTEKAEALLNKLDKVEITVEKMKQVIALKYFAKGEISDEEYQKLTEGGAKGMSTFMAYYILKADAIAGGTKQIDMIKEYFGGITKKSFNNRRKRTKKTGNSRWIHYNFRCKKYSKQNPPNVRRNKRTTLRNGFF